jgi:hypothetical protein
MKNVVQAKLVNVENRKRKEEKSNFFMAYTLEYRTDEQGILNRRRYSAFTSLFFIPCSSVHHSKASRDAKGFCTGVRC